ncbi:MAG: Hsp70 family protein [Myxococcota bacterium]
MVCYLGIDLGTTNTAAAVFDGDAVTPVRTREGGLLTPSVVRIDARGRVTVGARARKLVDRDPDNTLGGFKRLMGTARGLVFPGACVERRPEELAAEILRSIRDDVREQVGFLPEQAVISVPALFELPQSAATHAAAQLAGFAHVELIQEPVASALAAGWSADEDGAGAWLVYDLGGGTFDVSLLETREGVLRVIGHDGDNFLGGRDLDEAIVRWALAELAADGLPLDRADPALAMPLRVLRTAAEDAKIDLSRSAQAALTLPALFDGPQGAIDVDLTLDRTTLEQLAAPLVDKTLAVCRRLLAAHGLGPEQVRKVVLVGGPTAMPFLRDRVQAGLGAPFAEGVDPMALVATGAAIHAATVGLDARPAAAAPEAGEARRLWLEYPTMSPDPTPFVVGRLLDGPGPAPVEVRFVRDDGGFATPWTRLGPDGTLLVTLELREKQPNAFTLEGRDAGGAAVPLLPPSLTLVCGRTLAEPPLSRTVGVALANDAVHVYLQRGTPLPAKRSYVHRSVAAVAKGSSDAVIRIPIVQGEHPQAHLCRLVGHLEISGEELRADLPADSDVEVTVEIDRGGRLSARALVPCLSQVFEQVAHLSIPEADPAALAVHADALGERLSVVRSRPGLQPTHVDRLLDVEWSLQDAQAALLAARGGDDDAGQRAHRLLIEADAALGEVEDATRWPELDQRVRNALLNASGWVGQLGTPQEQRMLSESGAALEHARQQRDGEALERHLRAVNQLTAAAYFRHPDSWRHQFEHLAADVGRSRDPLQAQRLVAQGREAVATGDRDRLRDAVLGLEALLPARVAQPIPSFRSDLR